MKNSSRKLLSRLILAGLFATVLAGGAYAGEAEDKGFEISARSDRSDRGFIDSTVEMKMVLRNAHGQETTRTLELKTFEIQAEDVGDKSLIIFDTPADIYGTALLSYAKILDPDDQWLYLPALKRVKRISSVNKSGPFVGSEFAFEDFTSQELNKYSYKYLGEEACGDLICDIVERTPLYQNSGYTKQIGWIDQSVFQTRKVDFYDRKGALLKTLDFEDYREYDGGIWRAQTLRMKNHLTGKSTDLIYSEYSFKTGLSESDFQKGVLRRVR